MIRVTVTGVEGIQLSESLGGLSHRQPPVPLPHVYRVPFFIDLCLTSTISPSNPFPNG